MIAKRFLILTSIIFYCFSNSFAQNNGTFNWTDTSFTVGSERLIELRWDADNSIRLAEESKITCDTIINFMKKNQNVKIGIYCNTDQQCDYQRGIFLSQHRAQNVTNYCIYNGVDSARIIPKGWGATRLIYTTQEIIAVRDLYPKIQRHKRDSLYQINRRTEVVILKTDYKK